MSGFGFPAQYKLKKTDEYSSVFNYKRRLAGAFLSVYYMPNDIGHPRFGMIVAKKVARTAVGRNYMKRILRELFRHECRYLGGIDLVVRPLRAFSRQDIAQVREEFIVALSHVRSRTPQARR